MEYGINVDTLQKNRLREETFQNSEKTKYKSKIVEYTFFVQNEIEICEKLNFVNTNEQYNNLYHFLTIQNYDFVKICETNKEILEKMNIEIDLNTNNKKFVLLRYKKDIGCDIDKMGSFIDSFFYHNHINNTSIYPDKPRASFIFWDFIHIYENFFDDFKYLTSKNILFLDFSSKNLFYNKKYYLFYNKFDKCLIQHYFDISSKDLGEDGDLQKLTKYVEIEKYIDKFIKIIESIDYYSNKHFDLYLSKHLIKNKNFHIVYQKLDNIIEDYLNNLYFLKNFSEKFKNEIKLKWKVQIKNKIEENVKYFNIEITKINWKLYILMMLDKYQCTVWETFSLNSLFLNITYCMIKIFNITNKLSVVHRYFKFLFKNMDINCTNFNNNNNININTCKENYDKFRDSFENNKDFDNLANFFSLSHVTIEQQEELYDLLSKNVEKF
jgi:hypothetical protein